MPYNKLQKNSLALLFSRTLMFAVLLVAGVSFTVFAENIRIPIGQQTNDATEIKMPAKGSTKAGVSAEFGEPIEKVAPKGTPPISQWKYSDFVVYFEYDHVIHSVRVFKPKTAPASTEN